MEQKQNFLKNVFEKANFSTVFALSLFSWYNCVVVFIYSNSQKMLGFFV
jgi:hypothetical protein